MTSRRLKMIGLGTLLPLLFACGREVGREEVDPVVELEMTVPPAGAAVDLEPARPNAVREAQLTEAREAGFTYWAIGNEPGWTLRAGDQLLEWTTEYGETTWRLEPPEQQAAASGGESVYRGEAGGSPLVVRFLHEACADDMSGEAFSVRVVVEHADRVYRGCGERLDAPAG